jgi:hypothetical protein
MQPGGASLTASDVYPVVLSFGLSVSGEMSSKYHVSHHDVASQLHGQRRHLRSPKHAGSPPDPVWHLDRSGSPSQGQRDRASEEHGVFRGPIRPFVTADIGWIDNPALYAGRRHWHGHPGWPGKCHFSCRTFSHSFYRSILSTFTV